MSANFLEHVVDHSIQGYNKHLLINNVIDNYRFYLKKIFPKSLSCIIRNELFFIVPARRVYNVIDFLKNHTHSQYKVLVDITGVDYPEKKSRFEVTYNLLSLVYNSRITVSTFITESTGLDSITTLFKAASWYERETWDMYGIHFYGHSDLRRILTDYGFKGHPLRKDFPLTGYVEVRYDQIQKRVITEKLLLAQDYRNFEFDLNWLN